MTRFENFTADMGGGDTKLSQIEAPGTGRSFTFLREAASGGVLQVSAGGRTYVETGRDGWTRLDGGLGQFRESRDDSVLRRDWQTPDESWQEVYGFGTDGKLAHVDGVDIHRDDQGRVTACVGGADLPDHRWFYAYTQDGLVAIDGPRGPRHLSRQADGRVTAWRSGGQSQRFDYDAKGRMRGITALRDATHHRDEAGRVWSVTDTAGRVLATYVWDGWRCIGRIDGGPGDPLAAFFSLDPSATPVRVIAANGVTRIPRDAYGEGLCAHTRVPGLFGAYQAGGVHHLPWRILHPKLGAFTAPDPFDGSDDDPRRAGGEFQGDLDVETDLQRQYDVCRDDPVSRADPSGGISAGLLLSSLTWSFQNNLLSFFGIDWWFNLFGSLVTPKTNFFDSEGLVSSKHIGAFGVRRDGVVSKIMKGRAFTTQHIVWNSRQSFEALNDGMVIDPGAPFDPPLLGGPLLAAPVGQAPILLRGTRGGVSRAWHRSGGTAAPAFPGADQPVFPQGGFHLTSAVDGQPGPVACALSELVPGPGVGRATPEAEAATQRFDVWESGITAANLVPLGVGDAVLLEDGLGEVFRTRVSTFERFGRAPNPDDGNKAEIRFADHVPDTVGPTGIALTRLSSSTTVEEAQAPGGGVRGFSARGLSHSYGTTEWLEIRSAAGGDDVTLCHATGAEARLPLDAPVPAGMTAPLSVVETALSPPVSVTLDGTHGLTFPTAATPPAVGIIGLVSDGTTHLTVRIDDDAAAPVIQTDTDLSALGTPLTFRTVTAAGLLGRRADPVEADPWVTFTPTIPGSSPDGSTGPVVVLISGGGGVPDAARVVTGAPIYDAILTDTSITPAAPWTVERWPLASGQNVINGLWTIEEYIVAVDDPSVLSGVEAVRVLNVNGAAGVVSPSTTHFTNLTMDGDTATFSGTGLPAGPRPSDVVIVSQAGNDTLHSVTGLRLSFDFDRPVAIDPETDSYVVRLRPAGFAWEALRLTDTSVIVTPMVDGVRGQFPRLRIGAAMQLRWDDGGTAQVHNYRVTTVEGLAVTLDGPTVIPASVTPGSLTAQLLEADDPGTGHQKLAINLDRPATASDRQAQADVWSPDAFTPIRDGGVDVAGGEHGYGLISGGITTPVLISPFSRDLTIRFAADTGLTGAADLSAVDVNETFELPITAATTQSLTLTDVNTVLEEVILQPFVTSPATITGQFLPGDVIIPNEEHMEIDRRQALIDHELVHTEQYHKFGPIWFCYFPLFLAELPVEFTTDLDQPNFGPSSPGTLARVGSRVRITPTTSIDVDTGDKVQVFQGGEHEEVTVSSMDGETIVIQGSVNMREGAVELRKVHDDRIWSEVLLSISRITTHGGLLNKLVGFTWGGLLWLLSKGIYGAVRAMGGAGDQFPGTVVEAGRAIELTDADGRRELNADGQFIIKSGEQSVVRRATRSGDRLNLDQPIAFRDDVDVSAYASLDPGAAFDWLQYKAGTVDETNSAAIDLPGEGGNFTVGDRVEYIYLGRSGRTHIAGITGDRIELEDVIAVSGAERSIRVALLAEAGTTLANADEAALNWMGMGWMRVLFDPYGQIEARVRPEGTWPVLLLRVMRVIMGSRNFSAVPMLGYVFWSRLFSDIFEDYPIPPYRATIEQDASEKSGDLYSPMSRITGDVRRPERYGNTFMSVGDIARFRFWEWTGVRDLSSIAASQGDPRLGAPGLHLNNRETLRVIINRTNGPDNRVPNLRTVTNTAGAYPPATALPDRLFTKNFDATLGDLTPADNMSFVPADLGAVPLSTPLVRNPSTYVSFCKPGSHRATLTNTTHASVAAGLAANDDVTQAYDAQRNDGQNIWFNITARDVVVRVNGQTVAEGDTVTLVQTQTARITVDTHNQVADIARTFRASIAQPDSGDALRRASNLRLVAQGGNSGLTPDHVEISRFYDFDEDTGTYSDTSLAPYGMHLGGDLDIPVRAFDIAVTDQLTLVDAARADSPALPVLQQGATGFLLIPTSAGEGVTYTIDGAPAGASDPELTFASVALTQNTRSVVGALGQVRSVSFSDETAIAASAAIEVSIPVTGEDGAAGTLRCAFTLDPPA